MGILDLEFVAAWITVLVPSKGVLLASLFVSRVPDAIELRKIPLQMHSKSKTLIPAFLFVGLLVGGCDQAEGPGDAERLEIQDDVDAAPAVGPGAGEFAAETQTQEGNGNHGNNKCQKGIERYPEHGVYDTTIVYMIDEIAAPGEGPFLPMDVERNTLEYRTDAYAFFDEQYGIDFDPADPANQNASDGLGGLVQVQPIKTGFGDTSTHQVYGVDAQDIPQWRNKMPLTNVAFRDDGYFVFILADFTAHGEFGGAAGLTLRAGDILVFGDYRMFDHKDRLLDTIHYRALTPATVNPFAGAASSSDGANFVNITCDLQSDIFGEGLVRGLGEMRPLPDGSMDLDFRYVMRFPARLSDSELEDAQCKMLRPL